MPDTLAAVGEAGALPSAAPGVETGVEARDDHAVLPGPVTDRRFVVGAMLLIMVLASMEMTVISTAMPTIIGTLHGLEHYSWVTSLYLLACTVTMPLYGRLADVLGRKKVILFATLLFTVGSVMAAFSQSMVQLIVFRGVQGLGAGGIMPVVLTILGDLFTLKERARMQGLFSAVWGISSLAGPAFGAFLVHTLGWRWVFLVNLPFGLLGLLVLVWKYHDHQKPHSTALDLPGIALLCTASVALLSLVSGLGPGGLSNNMIGILATVTVIATAAFVWHERRTEAPVLPPSLLMRREVGPNFLAMLFFGCVFLALDTFVPLYVQGGRGGGAGAAATVVTPVMLTWATSHIFIAPLMIRWGFRKVALMGCIAILVGFSGLVAGAFWEWPQWALTSVLAVTGFGFGASSIAYLLGAQDAVDYHQRGIVTSTVSFCRTIGGSMGVGLLGAGFNYLSADQLSKLAEQGVPPATALDPHTQATLSAESLALVRSTISGGLRWVFVAMLVVAVGQLVATLMMRRKMPSTPVDANDAMAAG
ncbi:MAG TPA: MFS transporter [Tepidisphaeraceae bacterium]|jgi:MFS family permease